MTRRRLRDSNLAREDGFAVVIALVVMVITLLLAGVAVAVSVNTDTTTSHDGNAKAAIEAADTGARVAAYRLSQYQPTDNACPATAVPQTASGAAVGATGLCAMDGPEALGNGATYEYWVSRAMVAGDTCVGPAIDSSQIDVSQRCVTAIGTANGVSARVQVRVAQYTSTPVFQTAIFGTKSVTISNNETIVTDTPGSPALLGTNGVLTVGGASGGGTTSIDGYSLPPGASLSMGQNVTNNGPTTGRLVPYPNPQVSMQSSATNTSQPYNTSTTFQGGTCNLGFPLPAGDTQTNCNYRLTALCGTTCDTSSGTVIFNPVDRSLYLGNNATLALGGGVYNFCYLYLSNNAVITVPTQSSIFIDSPFDVDATGHQACPSGSSLTTGVQYGTFTMQQNSTLNAGGSALNAQIYVYGDPTHTPPTNNVTLTNNGSSSFGLDAPFSNVNLSPSNNTIFRGAITGYAVTIGNAGHFTYEADTGSLKNPAQYSYYRTYWEQCAGSGSTSAPTTGC